MLRVSAVQYRRYEETLKRLNTLGIEPLEEGNQLKGARIACISNLTMKLFSV